MTRCRFGVKYNTYIYINRILRRRKRHNCYYVHIGNNNIQPLFIVVTVLPRARYCLKNIQSKILHDSELHTGTTVIGRGRAW